jgi:hypothetical protein
MRYSYTFLFFCLLFCLTAFPQNSGTIQCDPGSTVSVPAWIEPGRPQVFEQLSCGQLVSVIGRGSFATASQYSSRPSEYVKIEIADKVAYVDAKYVLMSKTQQPLTVNIDARAAAERKSTREEQEQKKWKMITRDDLKLRDEKLLNGIYVNGPRTFAATVSNDSAFAMSHLHLLVRLYDCAGKPATDYSNCEIIGEVDPVVPVSIPAGQIRQVNVSIMFDATPRVRGTLAWGYRILGVRAE